MKTILRLSPAASIAAMFMSLLSMLATSNAFPQARLVKDINTAEVRRFNEYSQLTNAHGIFYFVNLGKELWKSDGTPEGTVRVKALRVIENLTLIGNTLYFAGKDQDGLELWKSDGTPAGTVRVKDIRKGVHGSAPKLFTGLNGTVFFVATDGRGEELWKTDGTSNGTFLVKDIRKGVGGSKPLHLTAMDDKLYFTAYVGKHGRELWKSDGNAAGTMIVKDIEKNPGRSSEPEELVTLNGSLYFSANESISGKELWKSDGTENGTAQLKDINPGTASSGITSIRVMGDNIYFNANNGTTGTALWRSGGTEASTAMVKDVTINNVTFNVHDMTALNNRLYWVIEAYSIAEFEMPRHEVWVSDGSAAGTRLVTTFEERHTPARFTFTNNKVFYFSGYFNDDQAVDDIHGPFQQLCSINPDGSGWQEIWLMQRTFGADTEGPYADYLPEMIAFNNAIIFPGVKQHGESYKLLKTEGTEAGTSVIIDTYEPTQSSSPNTMVNINSGVLFLATSKDGSEKQLWHTDGTTEGTILLKANQSITNLITIDNTAYFMTWGYGSEQELWKSDGTPAGTAFVKELHYEPMFLNVAGNALFYNHTGDLWKSDGTTAGTVLLKQFAAIEHAVAFGNVAYIIVRTESEGQELWKTDVSGEMVKVKTIRSFPGPDATFSVETATLGNILYFVGHDGTHGYEMWRTDGTEAGTYIASDIRTGDEEESGSDIWSIIAFKDALYINARDMDGELSLFKSDGTISGTKEIYYSHVIRQYIPYNDQLLFISNDGTTTRLFSTDGTSAETTMLHTLPTVNYTGIANVLMDGILYIGLGSDRIWGTDGTACGTKAINVGVKTVNNLTAVGDNLMVFSAYHDFYGEELFSIHASSLPKPLCLEALIAGQISELSAEHAANVTYAPNPFNSDITVVVNSDLHSTAEVVVQDMAGQPVISQTLETNRTYRLGNSWRDGIYIMRIEVDGKVTHKRIVKGGQ